METRLHGAISGESNTDDVKVLGTGVLHVLKDIGTSDALGAPSPSEIDGDT